MTNSPFLVIGATGKTGKRVLARLLNREAPVRAASRTSTTPFDWDRPETWPDALAGTETAYLVPPSDADRLGDCVTAFRAAGGRRVVLLSAQNPHREQLELEQAVTHNIPEWTILRPTWFSQNFSEDFFASQLRDGELRLNVGDAAVAFVDAEDIADAAVAALTEDGHDHQAYELTGPRRLGFREALDEISRASGHDFRFVSLSDEDFHQEQLASGADPDMVNAFAALLRGIRAGDFSGMSSGVKAATGHEPRDFSSYVAAAVEANAWGPARGENHGESLSG